MELKFINWYPHTKLPMDPDGKQPQGFSLGLLAKKVTGL